MKQFKYFTVFNYEREEKYLRSMHKSGWKFQKVTGLGMYHFEKCEPDDVIYRLDYNQEGNKNKSEYIQMFVDCGWEYMQEFVGYSYFRKPAAEADGNDEIFSDSASKAQMSVRVFKGRMMPLIVLFFAVLVPQLFLNLFSLKNYLAASFFGGVILLYIVCFTVFGVKYYNQKRK